MSSSQLLLKPPKWVVVRMTRNRVKGCDGCGRWRLRFVGLLILSFALCSSWVFCEVEKCGFLWRKEENGVGVEEKSLVSLEHFELNKSQLQAMAFLFSTMGQKPFSECLDKSLTSMPWRESISQALKLVRSTWYHLQNQQELMGDNTTFHDQCPMLDGYISELNSSSFLDGHEADNISQDATLHNEIMHLQEFQNVLHPKKLLKSKRMLLEGFHTVYGKIFCLALFGMVGLCKGLALCETLWKSSNHKVLEQQQLQQQYDFQSQNSKGFGRWRKNFLWLGVFIGLVVSLELYLSMNSSIISRRKENLATMCDERARMLQDQFNVSMNHVHALAILVSTFHHGKHPSAIDQKTFAEYTARTSFERPLISGVAYALKLLHSQRELFEKRHGWRIKKMETEDQSAVQDDYIPEKLDSSPVQDEYAPVIFSQETVSHIVSVDMMSGKA